MFYENTSVFCHLDNEGHFEDLYVVIVVVATLFCTSQVKKFSEPYDDIWYVTCVLIVEARQWFFLLHIVRTSFQQNFQTSVAPQLSSFSAVTPWYFFLFSSCYFLFACIQLLFYVLIGIVFLFSKHIQFTPTYTFMALLNDIILKFEFKF